MLLDGTTGIDMVAGCVLIFDKSLAFNPRDDMTRTTEKIKRPLSSDGVKIKRPLSSDGVKIKRPLSSDGRRSPPTRGSMNLHLQPETDLPRQLCQSGSLAYQVPHLKLSIQSNHVLGLVQYFTHKSQNLR
ncbi:hypothetical protein DPMN_189275 [Dreissena polymorpha]|uniref:Uncharacterized protein n=1 Tax=Dreissena polymorpha TaxID=45954 RepID=A0A9D4DV79_DREPO|nr:hypothetical protein DPMN_189275 [Dreissena polymorpha]